MTDILNWLIIPFELGFQQRALYGGIIAVVMTSTVGIWVVLQGMSFFGDAFVHGVLPGIATAVIFGFSPIVGAAIAAGVMIFGVEFVHRQTKLSEDTAIGLLYVAMTSLGVAIISKSDSYAGNLTSILFGDAFGVSLNDIIEQGILAVILVGVSIIFYRPFLALSLSPEKSKTLNMHPKRTHTLLLIFIAIAIIGSFQSVGTLLVFGLLVGPPATASLLSRTVPIMYMISIVTGSLSVFLGLALSFHLGTAGSATIAFTSTTLFFSVLIIQQLRSSLQRKVIL